MEFKEQLTELQGMISKFMEVHNNPHDTSKHNETAGKLEVLETLLATVITNDLSNNGLAIESKNLAKVSDEGDLVVEKRIAENRERGTFGFNEMEKETSGGIQGFGARVYDGRIGRWWSIDLSNLSKSEKEAYHAKIEVLSANKHFKTYYNHLVNSEISYIILSGEGGGGSGSFDPSTNTVSAINDSYTLAQELFHAFQTDLGVYTSKDNSVREAEGDIVSSVIAMGVGAIGIGIDNWDQGISYTYPNQDFLFDEKVFSEEFDNTFNKAVDTRIEYYKERSAEVGLEAPRTYVQDNSNVGALALKNIVRSMNQKQEIKIPALKVKSLNSEGNAEIETSTN